MPQKPIIYVICINQLQILNDETNFNIVESEVELLGFDEVASSVLVQGMREGQYPCAHLIAFLKHFIAFTEISVLSFFLK